MNKKNTEVRISTLIGKGCELTGNFTAQGSARIDGKVDGDVTVTGSLLVGAGGCISGNVSAASVLIGGEVIGNVEAPEKTELTATAKVIGDITTKVIVIDEHAVFQGKVDMNQAVPDRKSKSAAAKAVRAGRKTAKAAIAEALKEVEALEAKEISAETVKTVAGAKPVAEAASGAAVKSSETEA